MKDLCTYCAGTGEVETMDGREACPACYGRQIEQRRLNISYDPEALKTAVKVFNQSFKRRNK